MTSLQQHLRAHMLNNEPQAAASVVHPCHRAENVLQGDQATLVISCATPLPSSLCRVSPFPSPSTVHNRNALMNTTPQSAFSNTKKHLTVQNATTHQDRLCQTCHMYYTNKFTTQAYHTQVHMSHTCMCVIAHRPQKYYQTEYSDGLLDTVLRNTHTHAYMHTLTQTHRHTDTQRHREAETQRHRFTETHSHRDRERQRVGAWPLSL